MRVTVLLLTLKRHIFLGVVCSILLLFANAAFGQSTPVTVGYRDYFFGNNVDDELTGEKPQSKLWWNDGFWWGSLWDPDGETYRIYRFDIATQSWTSTGTAIDDRGESRGDVLWDGSKLYVASHIFSGSSAGGPADEEESARLYRYSYDSASKSYSLDNGFPVVINGSTAETLTLAKDSSGQLWISWVENSKVIVNSSQGSDQSWGNPFDLPGQGTSKVDADDISGVIAFDGNKIGVMWSNQREDKIYFGVHEDNKADNDWENLEVALSDNNTSALVSDDHLNLKPACDNNGNVYAIMKTGYLGSEPLMYLLKRSSNGSWSKTEVWNAQDNTTRGILVIDEDNDKLYVFAREISASPPGRILMKVTDLGDLSFQDGPGTPFIVSDLDGSVNNPTSTKQCINNESGILVLASDKNTNHYLHNFLDLNAANRPAITQFTPSAGSAGTPVTLTGNNFNGTTLVTFNGVADSAFQMVSDREIQTTVPEGAGTGLISVTNPDGTGFSTQNFIVSEPPFYLTTLADGPGTITATPPGGVYDSIMTITLEAEPLPGFLFTGWSGDLSGTTNPATLEMNSDKTVTANFAAQGGGNAVVHEESVIGGLTSFSTITTNEEVQGVDDDLYLIAISTKEVVDVETVSGLGLNWSHVLTQCGGRNQTAVELWMGQGNTNGSGFISAQVDGFPENAVMIVSRYSNVDENDPLGEILSGNTNGEGGACSGGVDNGLYSFGIGADFNGSMIFGTAAMRNRSHSPGEGFTEAAEHAQGGGSGTSASVAVQNMPVLSPGNYQLSGTFSNNVDWAVIGVVINPEGGSASHFLSLGISGAGVVDVDPPGLVYDSGDEVTLNAIPDPGFIFAGWEGDLETTLNPITVNIDSNVTLLANFEKPPVPQYQLMLGVTGPGTILLDPPGGVYDSATVVRVHAIPEAGFGFSGWSGDLAGFFNPDSILMDSVKTVTASFQELPEFNLSVNVIGAGSVLTDPPGTVHDSLSQVIMTAVPAPGYYLSAWVGDLNSSENPDTLFIDGHKNVTAIFEQLPQFTLTTNVFGSGTIISDPPGGIYDSTASVALTAIPDPGYEFVGWAVDLKSTENPDTIYIDGNKNVTAKFLPQIPGGGSVNFLEIAEGGSSGSDVVATSGNLTAVSGDLYLAAVSTRNQTEILSMDGLGLAWQQVAIQCGGRNQTGVEVWMAQGNPTGDGPVTATLADDVSNAAIAVSRYSGVDDENPIGNVVSGNSNGLNGACSGGEDSNSYSFDISAASEGTLIYGAAALRNRSHSPGNGFDERAEVAQGSGGSTATLAVQDQTVDNAGTVQLEGDFSSTVDWAVIGIEIRPGSTVGQLPQFSITLEVIGPGGVTLDPPGGVYDCFTEVTLTAVAQPNFTFRYWGGDLTGSENPASVIMDTTKHITVYFTDPPPQYQLQTSIFGSGSINLNPPGGVYDSASTVIATAAPDSGHRFIFWSGDMTGASSPDTILMDTHKSITAAYIRQFALNINKIGRGQVVMSPSPIEETPSGGLYDTLSVVILTAIPDSGYLFQGWSGDINGLLNPSSISMAADRNVTALFTPRFPLTVTSNGAGAVAVNPPSQDGMYDSSTVVALTAIPTTGNIFTGWSGDLSGLANPDTVVIDSAIAVTANFSAAYTLNLTPNGMGTIAVDPAPLSGTIANGVYAAGTSITITAVPELGHGFSGWSGSLTGNENPATLVINSDNNIVATFEEVPGFALDTRALGSGTIELNPPGGLYDPNTVVSVTAVPATGYHFLGWVGDLSGDVNPQSLTMDDHKEVTAKFVAEVPGAGVVSYEEIQTGESEGSASVSTSANITAESGQLYLAAIATKSREDVTAVSGLGLNWNLVQAQCSGRNQTGVEVWMAIGEPTGDDIVTATLNNAVTSASIAVTRYAGVDAENPIGAITSGNSNGEGGACTGGTDSDAYSFPLGNLDDGAIAYGAAALRNRSHEPGAGYTELAEVTAGSGGSIAGLAVQYQEITSASAVDLEGTLNRDVDWAAIGIELRSGSAIGELPQFPLTATVSGNGSVQIDPPGGIYECFTEVTLTAVPDEGYLFSGWTGDINTLNNPESVIIDTAKTVMAIFIPEGPQYNLTTNAFGSGSIVADPASPTGSYSENTVVTLSAVPAPGYEFTGWGGDLNGFNNPVLIIMDGDKNITAAFAELPPPQYTLTLDSAHFGNVIFSPTGGVYEEGTQVTVAAFANSGYEFSHWNGDFSGNTNPLTIAMDGDKHFAAIFIEEGSVVYTLNINQVGNGSVTLDPPGGIYAPGTDVTLTPAADAGFEFSHWTGDLVGTANPAAIVMDGNKTVTAHYNEIIPQYSLNLGVVGAGNVTLNPAGGIYDAGTVVTLTASADAGMNFGGWSGDLSGSNATETITMDSDKNVTASFIGNGGGGGGSGGPVVLEEFQTGGASDVEIVSLETPVSLANGELYLAAITAKNQRDVISVSGLGLTWSEIRDQCSGRNQTGVSVWMAIGNPSGGGIVTAEVTHATANMVLVVSRYSGVDPSDPIGMILAGNTNGLNGDCSGGTDGPAYSFDITTETEDAIVYGAIAMRNRRHTPGNGYTEQVEYLQDASGLGGSDATLAVMDQAITSPSQIAFDGEFNKDVDWAVVGFEIRSGGSSGGTTQHILTVNTIGAGSVMMSPAGGIYDEGTAVSITATPASGFQFSGWSGDASGSSNPVSVTMNSPKNVTATFTEVSQQFTLLTSVSGSGNITLSPAGGAYDAGTVVTITATPTQGYLFSAWGGDLAGSISPATITMDSDKTVSAAFVEENITTYTLTTTTVGNGAVTLNPPGGVYAVGTVVTMTASPAAGYTFGGWSGDVSSTNLIEAVLMDADKTVAATFDELPPSQHSLSVNIFGSGNVTLDPPGGIYTAGTVVTISAIPDAGHQFVNWSGDLDGSITPESILIDADKNVTAIFESVTEQFDLNLGIVGAGSVTLSPPGGVYDAGTVVTLLATPDAGMQFNGWGGDLTGTTNPSSITMDADKNITAAFITNNGGGGGSGGPVVFEEIDNGGATEMFEVSSGGNISLVNGDLYLASIITKNRTDVLSVSGMGLSWSRVDAQCSARNQNGMEVWMAMGNPSGNGVVTATLASSPSNSAIAVARYSGVDPSNPIGEIISGNTLGLDGDCSGGTDNAGYSFNISTATEDAVVYGAIALRNRRHTAGDGYTERGEFIQDGALGGDKATMAIQDQSVASPAQLPFDGSFNKDVDWAVVAFEIRSGGSGATQHILSVNTIGAGSVSMNPAGGLYEEGTTVSLTATPAAGFEFNGWSGDVSGNSNPVSITMDAAKTVTATFTEVTTQFTLSTNTVGSGTITTTPAGPVFDDGSQVLLTATPAAGFEFSGWSGDLSGAVNPMTLTMDANKNVTATFVETTAQYTISTTVTGQGSVLLSPPGGVYDAGTVVTISATPASGYNFNSWSGDLSGSNNPQILLVDGNKSVTAVFEEAGATTYTLTTAVTGSGSITMSPSGGVYDAGTVVTLTAIPAAGFEFANWSGDLGGTTNPMTVTMDADKNITAIFSELPPEQFTLDVSAVGAGNVSLSPAGGVYDAGTVVTLMASADAGNNFSGWAGDLTGNTNPASIMMTSNKTVIATFNPQSGGGGGGGPVVFEEIDNGGATEMFEVSSGGNISLVNGDLYLASIITKNRTDVLSVSGMGLSWSRVDAQCSARDQNGMEVWMAIGNPSGSGVVTATLASSPSNSAIAVARYSGVDPSNPIGEIISGNTLGLDGDCSGGTDNAGYSFNISTATEDAVVYGAIALRNRRHTAGDGYTERGEFIQDGALGGDKATMAIQDQSVASPTQLAFDGTFNKNVDWAVVAFEIRSGGSGGSTAQYDLSVNTVGSGSVSMSPAGGSYDEGTVVSLTAVPDGGYEFSGWSGDETSGDNPVIITMDGNKTLTATFTESTPQYTLNTIIAGNGTLTLSPAGGVYDAGTVVTITAAPDAGHGFSSWAGDVNGAANPVSVTMDGNKTVTAVFVEVIEQFTLTTNIAGDGTVTLSPAGGVYDAGTVVTLTPTPSQDYSFTGWSGDASGLDNPLSITMDGNKAVTATFTEVLVQFTLDTTVAGNGAVALSPDGGVYDAGTVVTITATPAEGFTFGGWSGDAGGSDNPLTMTMDGNKAITATFNEIIAQYTINTTVSGSGSVTLTPPGGTYDAGTEIVVTAVPDEGFTFDGWSGDLSGSDNPDTIIVDAEKNITATFGEAVVQYTLTTTPLGNGVITLDPAGGTYDAGTVVTVTAVPNPGNVFGGWAVDITGLENPQTITMDSDKTVMGAFVAVTQYALNANVIGAGSVTLDPPGGVYNEGTTVTVTAVPDSGNTFQEWAGDVMGTENPAAIVMDAEKTLAAIFAALPPTQHTLTATANGSGSVTLNPAGGAYDEGTEVTMTAAPDSGYQFDSWSGDLISTDNPATVTMDSSISVAANFSEIPVVQYSLTVNTTGSGSVTLSPAGGVYDAGTVVTITAVPDTGHQFDGWSGDASGSALSTTITMDSDKTVGAAFSEIPPVQYTLTVNINGNGSVTLNPAGGVYDAGTQVSLTATPDAGNDFSGWSGDVSDVAATVTITMDDNKQVTAGFNEQSSPQYTISELVFGSGSIIYDPPGGTYAEGAVVTVTAMPDAGYQFSGWSGDLSGFTNPSILTMDANKSLIAAFTELPQIFYSLNTSASGSGSVVLNPPGGTYQIGTVVTVTAVPDAGNQFDGWSGGIGGTANPQTVTMLSDITATANFSAETVKAGGGTIVHRGTQAGGATETSTVSTGENIPAITGDLYLAAIVASPAHDVLAVDGLGLSWQRIDTQVSARSKNSVEIWMASGTPAGDDVVTADFDGRPSNSLISISRYSGVDSQAPLGAIISANTLGLDGAASGGRDNDAYALRIPAASEGAVIFGAVASRNRQHSAGANSTEHLQIHQDGALDGNKATLAIHDRVVDLAGTIALEGSFSNTVDWAVIGLELRPEISPSATLLPSQNASLEITNTFGWNTETKTANYFQFDIENASHLAIESARLRVLTGGDGSSIQAFATSNYYRNSRALWLEGDLDAENAPETKGTALAVAGSDDAAGWLEFDVLDIIDTNDDYSFAIFTDRNPRAAADSDENTAQPQLLLTFRDLTAADTEPAGSSDQSDDVQLLNLAGGSLSANQTGTVPEVVALGANYPDPFNAETGIEYSLPQDNKVRLEVFNILGQRVRILVNEIQSAGFKKVVWNSTNDAGIEVASGVYFIQLTIGEKRLVGKMTLQK